MGGPAGAGSRLIGEDGLNPAHGLERNPETRELIETEPLPRRRPRGRERCPTADDALLPGTPLDEFEIEREPGARDSGSPTWRATLGWMRGAR